MNEDMTSLKMKIEYDYSSDEVLRYLQSQGNIDLDDVANEMRKKDIQKLLKDVHPYSISQLKDGRWKTHVKDASKKEGRRVIVKRSLEQLEEALFEFYTMDSHEDPALRRRTATLRSLYPEWIEYRTLHTEANTTIIRFKSVWKNHYLGTEIIDIPIRELERAFARVSDSDLEVARICQEKMSLISPDRDEDDLREAAKMYIALKDICTKYTLSALTLKCFDIIGSCHTTACLAMAMLNSEGIVCGCEGDIPALWTMVYANVVYGQPAFMANPASTSRSELTVDLAHCTIPLSMVHGYRLPSHFESRSGIGVAGSVPSGSYRLLKICGSGLDRLYSAEGDIIMNTNIPQRCRTQVRFKFRNERDFNDFLTVCKGNHLVIVKQ